MTSDEAWDEIGASVDKKNAQIAQDRKEYAAYVEKLNALAYQKAKEDWSLSNQKQDRDFAYGQKNKDYAEGVSIAKIKAQSSIDQANVDAQTQATISRIRSQSSAAVAAVSAKDSMLAPQFKQDKFDKINPKILSDISASRGNFGMYNALGGDQPVTRSSLGLADNMHSRGQMANMNNVADSTYSNAMQRSAANIADKYQKLGYSGNSELSSMLTDSMSGNARAMQEGALNKNYTDARANNQAYGLESNNMLNKRVGILADLKSSTQLGNSGLLGLLGQGV